MKEISLAERPIYKMSRHLSGMHNELWHGTIRHGTDRHNPISLGNYATPSRGSLMIFSFMNLAIHCLVNERL